MQPSVSQVTEDRRNEASLQGHAFQMNAICAGLTFGGPASFMYAVRRIAGKPVKSSFMDQHDEKEKYEQG